MAENNAVKKLQEWWGVVAIALVVLGGFFWLDKNYARIDKLAAEKCNLSYEIRLTKTDIELNKLDEELSGYRRDLELLLETADPPTEIIDLKKTVIKQLEDQLKEIADLKNCLIRSKNKCFQGDVDTDKCFSSQS